MAATLITRAGRLAARYLKPIGAPAYAIWTDGGSRVAASDAPTLTAGTGAPTEAAPDGSVYLRTDGVDATDSMYQRIAGAWVARIGT